MMGKTVAFPIQVSLGSLIVSSLSVIVIDSRNAALWGDRAQAPGALSQYRHEFVTNWQTGPNQCVDE